MADLRLVAVALAAVGTVAASSDPEYSFPLFRQCDPKWGQEMMGVKGPGERATICREGCAMSCVAMGLNGLGVYINNTQVNPGVLNSWLEENKGYVCAGGDCNNLVLQKPSFTDLPGSPLVLVGESQKPPSGEIMEGLANRTMIYVAHVHNSGHFVLLTSTASKTAGSESFQVNDPYYNTTVYPYANISDIISYRIVKPTPPKTFPLYKQCDEKWGSNNMGINNQTICQVGCLMSSISMALDGFNVQIEGATSTPATLNAFLRTHDGYVKGTSDLEESAVPKISSRITWPKDGMHTSNDLSYTKIGEYLNTDPPRVVIANVLHGHHFVLVTAVDNITNDNLYVHDPGFARSTYSYKTDVVGWRLFDILC